MTEREDVHKLAAELFRAVQMAQGYAFISDGATFATREEFFERIRGQYEWNKVATRRMRAFLKKHNALPR